MMTIPAGVAFSTAADGDLRNSPSDRTLFASRLRISDRWATVDQIHGSGVVRAGGPGPSGRHDAVFTTVPGLPVAVFTADCLGVALRAEGAAGVAHAGWRGVEVGVVPALVEAMTAAGFAPTGAAIGPGIGPCCFEVGSDVASRFPATASTTTWGTPSVDLRAAVRAQIGSIEVWESSVCTMCAPGLHSHRVDATSARMAAVAWIT